MEVSYIFAYQETQNDFFYHDGQIKNSQNLTQQSTKFLEGISGLYQLGGGEIIL